MTGINVVFGTATYNEPKMGFATKEDMAKPFDILEKYGIHHLDTAQAYGNFKTETMLGEVTPAGKGFYFDTKWPGGMTGQPMASSKEAIISSAKRSLENLHVSWVDVFYMHCPDKQTPIEDTLEGINEVYDSGAFKRFGLSNYSVSDVEAIHKICKDKGYVLPSVYQGNYSPIARLPETKLFPTLRRLNISFYAYSPLAGGFLTKTKAQIAAGAGRFNKEAIRGAYHAMFVKPAYVEALAEWEAAALQADCSKAELAYRWVAFHSPLAREHGDAILVGANGPEQLEQTLEGLTRGPLAGETVGRIEAIWESVKHEAIMDYFGN